MALIYIEYLFFGSDLQQRTAYINETKTLVNIFGSSI